MRMDRKRYSADVKEKVSAMRAKGQTYSEIRAVFPIAKSTLSLWLGKKHAGVFDRKAQLAHLKRIRLLSAASLRKNRSERSDAAAKAGKKAAHSLVSDDMGLQKALLSMLYWAEGTKAESSYGIRFVNTDPRLALLFLTLLRSCFVIDESKLKIRLHLHQYHSKEEALSFWSHLLQVPEKQFWKPYIKGRNSNKRFRKNFAGICFIYHPDQLVREEILAMAYEVHAMLCARSRSSTDRTQACGACNPSSILGGGTRRK